jgi:methylase of polypeptide subunit release factors
VHLIFLMRLIEKLQPTHVLEVGSGMGLNLCILAARFPNIRFTGIELTTAGDEVARAFRAMPKLSKQFVEFSPLPLLDEKRTRESNYIKAVRYSFHSRKTASIWCTASRLLSRWSRFETRF